MFMYIVYMHVYNSNITTINIAVALIVKHTMIIIIIIIIQDLKTHSEYGSLRAALGLSAAHGLGLTWSTTTTSQKMIMVPTRTVHVARNHRFSIWPHGMQHGASF